MSAEETLNVANRFGYEDTEVTDFNDGWFVVEGAYGPVEFHRDSTGSWYCTQYDEEGNVLTKGLYASL